MPKRFSTSLAAAAVAIVATAAVAGQVRPAPAANAAGAKFTPHRMPWGDPDISGNFTTKDEMNTPYERPDEFAGRRIEDVTQHELGALVRSRQEKQTADAPWAAGGSRERGVQIGVPIHWLDNLDAANNRPWLVVDPPDGKIPPLTAEAQKRFAALASYKASRGTADSYTDRSLTDRCISRGVPQVTQRYYGASYQILQSKDYVAIRYEMIHERRMIPINGRAAARPHPGSNIRSYFGDATARWEGNTLVVDTTNFSGRADYYFLGWNFRGSSDRLHMIERYTRTASNKVELSVTIDDPDTWTRPWTYSVPLTEDDGQPIFDYECHEGNVGLRNILSAGRSDDRKGIKSSDSVDEQGDLRHDFEE